jgi:hypothetical protein
MFQCPVVLKALIPAGSFLLGVAVRSCPGLTLTAHMREHCCSHAVHVHVSDPSLTCLCLCYASRATTNRKLKETVALELSFVNSNLQLLKEQLAELNSSVELYQNDR